MLKWFYKQKNSDRILFAVTTWLFVFVGVSLVGLLGAANGFTTMTPEELENPTLETSLIALVMLLIMGVSCLPGIFFTVHAVKAYKADKEAILPRPPHEIRAEMDQLNERSQKLRAEIKAQVFITNIDFNAYDGKKVRAINKEIRYITRRYKELEEEAEKGIKMGAQTSEAKETSTSANDEESNPTIHKPK